jgi:uncharacterized coiled-coil protein SlyX
MLAFI